MLQLSQLSCGNSAAVEYIGMIHSRVRRYIVHYYYIIIIIKFTTREGMDKRQSLYKVSATKSKKQLQYLINF